MRTHTWTHATSLIIDKSTSDAYHTAMTKDTQGPMRTRIAPSPTGSMHVGTLRTALYDYFLARQSGGRFILRIEDTDVHREIPGALENLLRVFASLGLDYDEGPFMRADGAREEKGDHGPYIQSQRLELYKSYADQLVAGGHAYPCFCLPERLAAMREEQGALKQAPRYDRQCLTLSKAEVAAKLSVGEPHVIRMKIPEGRSTFTDAIRGEISFEHSEVDDQIVIKSDGFPTYHLAVVVDDHAMSITHVLRGEEWISSTPKQIILHEMLGWKMPVYAHVPLLLNADKSKLSKRKGDVSVEAFLAKGYLPEALINFLALLGWNPTSDREIFSRDELIQMFDLSKVNRAGAVMNVEKLQWMNAQYIRRMTDGAYLKACEPWLPQVPADESDPTEWRGMAERACLIVRDRLEIFSQLPDLVSPLVASCVAHDPTMIPWKTQTPETARARLEDVRNWLLAQSEEMCVRVSDIDTRLRSLISERGWEKGDTLWPLRVALSGSKQSPSPFELLYVMGKTRGLHRIDAALATMKNAHV